MCRNRNLGQIPQKNFLNSQFIIPEKEEVESTHVPEKMQQSVHSLFPFHMETMLVYGELFTVKWKVLSLSTFCFHTSWSCFFVLQFLLNKVSKWKAFFEIGPCSYLHFLTLFNIYAFPWVWFQRFITSLIVPVSIRTNASVNPLSIIAGVIFVKTRIEG